MSLKIWFNAMQYGSAVQYSEHNPTSLRFATAERITQSMVPPFADTTLFLIVEFLAIYI
jgi:hypothetical protein